jgi:hypothetical protein
MDPIPSVQSSARQDLTSELIGPPRPDGHPHEALVADERAGLTPSQLVERKLISLLKANPLPVSHVTAGARTLRRR